MLTKTKEEAIVVLLSILDLGGRATKKAVLDNIETKAYWQLTPADRMLKHNRNEEVWRNDLAFARHGLVLQGYIDRSAHNSWAITPKGRDYFSELVLQIGTSRQLAKLTPSATRRALSLRSMANKTSTSHVQIAIPPSKSPPPISATAQQPSSDRDASRSDNPAEDYTEGQRALRERYFFSRNAALVKAAKERYGYRCQVCNISFAEEYGSLGEGYIECHHLNPLSERPEQEWSQAIRTSPDVVTVLCANCHRMIHRSKPALSLDALRKACRQAMSSGAKQNS